MGKQDTMTNKTSDSMVSIENLIEQFQPEFDSVESVDMQRFLTRLQNIVASNNTLILKSVNDILPLQFFVDDYQRGYKWLPQQVTELLNDIHEFDHTASDFYCLQPVVVKHHSAQNTGEKGVWELIDGQQRMTTVFMILSFLEHARHSIEYRTRKSSSVFLNDYLAKTLEYSEWDDFLANQAKHEDKAKEDELFAADLDNVDNYHFYLAYQTIANWFDNPDIDRFKWLNKLLYHTKFIWYAAREDNESVDRLQSIDIFMRINSGKIPLTNAELIKALLLNSVVKQDKSEVSVLQQSELGQQWDMIEHGLQNEDFWAFLSPSNRASDHTTRIELLFDLISGKDLSSKRTNIESQDKYYSFKFYSEKLHNTHNTNHKVDALWHEVKKGYYRLLEWFNDDELYHLVGFIVSRDVKNIQELWKLADQKGKAEFTLQLKKVIATELNKYFYNKELQRFDFDSMQYGSSAKKIISVLVLFNISVHRTNKTRLSFKTYRDATWDIEHVHAQQSRDLNAVAEYETWYEDQKALLNSNHIPDSEKKDLIAALDNWFAKSVNDLTSNRDLRNGYIQLLENVVGEIDDDEVNGLDNLCLLPSRVNRGIGNEVFSVKRERVIKYEREQNFFIPIATKNVFSKFYSDSVSQMYKWSANDKLGYREELKRCFKYYLAVEGEKQ